MGIYLSICMSLRMVCTENDIPELGKTQDECSTLQNSWDKKLQTRVSTHLAAPQWVCDFPENGEREKKRKSQTLINTKECYALQNILKKKLHLRDGHQVCTRLLYTSVIVDAEWRSSHPSPRCYNMKLESATHGTLAPQSDCFNLSDH
ncbi:hypothetical protein BaRGS_00015294 [Batillaria attramentaria]|uniref:Uncharacterized protein n=1 Tax=Batillaria attramentaria TaxID=370345 RepID=A0ABD0L1K3_9CAEN